MSDQPIQPDPTAQPETQPVKPSVKGEPMDLKDLLDLADITQTDIAAALVFFDDHAPDTLKGTLG
jgi:hypothetical protein